MVRRGEAGEREWRSDRRNQLDVSTETHLWAATLRGQSGGRESQHWGHLGDTTYQPLDTLGLVPVSDQAENLGYMARPQDACVDRLSTGWRVFITTLGQYRQPHNRGMTNRAPAGWRRPDS